MVTRRNVTDTKQVIGKCMSRKVKFTFLGTHNPPYYCATNTNVFASQNSTRRNFLSEMQTTLLHGDSVLI